MSPCCQCLLRFMLIDFVSGLIILARVQLIFKWLCLCYHCFNNVQLILCWLLVIEWLWFWSHYFSKVPFDFMSIVNLCLCFHCFKVQLIMCFCSHCFRSNWFCCLWSHYFKSNWMCFCFHCFRSNWFCIYAPIILGPIECVSTSTVSATVQLIALAKIECTWFVQIWASVAITCLIFVVLIQSCWVVEYFDVIMLSETQCATSTFVWAWMHVCLKVFACLYVCLRECESALCTYCRSWMSFLHKLKLKEPSQFLWHQASIDPNWWIT
jgi:hypothetical protein